MCLQSPNLGCFLLEGHEVQICDVDHVGPSHHRQHPVLHLPGQGAHVQQLPQLGLLKIKHTKKLIKHVIVQRLRP